MKIEVDAQQVTTLGGSRVPTEARLYSSATFVNGDDQLVVAGALDSKDFYKSVAVTNNAGVLTMATFTGTDAVDSTVNDLYDNGATYTLALYDSKGKRLAVLYSDLMVSDSLTPTTWANIDSFTHTRHQPYRAAYPTWEQLYNYVAGFEIADLASTTVYGRSKLSFVSSPLDQPEAVSVTDPRVNTLNAGLYADFNAAAAAAEALAVSTGRPTALETTSAGLVQLTAPLTTSVNVILDFKNGGFVDLGGEVLTVLGEIRAPAQRIFFDWEDAAPVISAAKFEHAYFEWYGITSGANNHAAMQALIDARAGSQYGSTVIKLLPGTIYSFATPLSFNTTYGFSIIGGNSGMWDETYKLRYTGSGATTAITFKSSQGFSMHGVCVEYNSATFTGFLLEAGHIAPTNQDTAGFVFKQCLFRGASGCYTAAAHISTNFAINGRIQDCQFISALKGIQGFDSGGGKYAVRIVVTGNQFNDCGYAIYQAGEMWTITSNSSEPVAHVMTGGIRVGDNRFYSGRGDTTFGMTMTGNWIGDVVASASTYFHIDLVNVISGVISGNDIYSVTNAGLAGQTTCIGMNACQSLSITGNELQQADRAIAYHGANSTGIILQFQPGCLDNTSASDGGFVGTGETRVGTILAAQYGSLTTFGGLTGGAPIGAGNTYLTVGCINGTLDTGAGSGVRVTENIAGRLDGTLIIQPRTNAAVPVVIKTASGDALTVNDTNLTSTVPLLFSTDNAKDIGAVGATRPRTGYFGTSVITPTVTVSTAIAPSANDGAPLGDTTHNFSDLFLATGAVINFNNGNLLLTHSAGILTMGTGEMRITTPGTNSASVVTVGGAQSLTAKTMTSPAINTPTFNGGAALGATSTEIDQLNDVSAYTETALGAGSLSVTKVVSNLALSGAGAVTLAAPSATMLGQTKTVQMTVDNGDVTMSLANVVGGTAATTCTWANVGEALVLLAGASGKWIVIKQYGVVLT